MPESVSEFLTRLALAPSPADAAPEPPAMTPAAVIPKPEVFHETPVTITDADARIPERYRAAKAKAVALGVDLVKMPPVEAPPPANTTFIPRDVSHAEYVRLRDLAVSRGQDWQFEPYRDGK